MKQCFLTQKGPRAIGPYSTAVSHNGVCYLSGVLPVDSATGRLVGEGIELQAGQVFENLNTILGEMGLSTLDILKTTVFLTDLGSFAAVNEIYATYFGSDCPARSCVQVSALPMGAQIEVEAIAATERE